MSAFADELFGADDIGSNSSDRGGPPSAPGSATSTYQSVAVRTFSDGSTDAYGSDTRADLLSTGSISPRRDSTQVGTHSAEYADDADKDAASFGSSDGSDGSWTIDELAEAVRESNSHVSDSRMANAMALTSDAQSMAAGQEPPEALRHVRSLVRQLSSQLKRPAHAEEDDGDDVDGASCDDLTGQFKRPKRVCHERLPDVLEGLASVERMLEKIGEELEEGCNGADGVGTFRSGAQVEEALRASERLNKQRRVLRIVTLRCQRLFEYVSSSTVEGRIAAADGARSQFSPNRHSKGAAESIHSISASSNTPLGSSAVSTLSSALGRVFGTEAPPPSSEADSSSAIDVSPLNVSTLPDGRRVLLLFCSPLKAPLDCTAEMANLQRVGLLSVSPPPTQGGSFDDLRNALRLVQPHVLWFAGHGDARQEDGRRTLGFSSGTGEIELFDPVSVLGELRPYLPMFGGNLECVILNACSTGGCDPSRDPAETRLGDLLKQCGAPSVICWGSPADNAACAAFAAGLGAALMQPHSVVAGSGVGGYSEAFHRGKREVLAVKMAGTHQGVQTQRYELVDPTDGSVVVQPYESPPPSRREVYRVRSGRGAGRVAAGVPRLLENAGSSEKPRASTMTGSSSAGNSRTASKTRLSWEVLLALAALLGAVLAACTSTFTSLPAPPATVAELRPQQLIAVDDQGHLHLDPSALDAIRASPSPVCLLSVTGPASEGKSTLANAMKLAITGATNGPTHASTSISGATDGSTKDGWFGAGAVSSRTSDVNGHVGVAWMWASRELGSSATIDDAECGSVLILDTAGVTGNIIAGGGAGAGGGGHGAGSLAGSLGAPQLGPGVSDAAQHRLLSFLLLTSSRIVLNTRRQPRLDLLERLVSSAAAAQSLRPPPLPEHGSQAAETSTSTPPCLTENCHAALPPPPGAAGPSSTRTSQSIAGAELIMLLRDSHMQLREGELTDRQVLSRWLPGAAGAAVEAATRAWTLRELAAPSQAELDTLERLGPRGHNQAAGSWGGELSSLAHELTSGLTVPSAWGGGAAADGDVLAAWMQHVAASLNAMGGRPGAGEGR